MTNGDNSAACPFGPDMQRYWKKRYEYFFKFDAGIQTDAQGLYSVVPEAIAREQALLIKGVTVVDAFSGIGGACIALALAGKKVTTIEIDHDRLQMARHNATLYGVADKITFIEGDALHLLSDITADAVYLDPPWGGPMRRRSPPFLLHDFGVDGEALLRLAFVHFNEVLLKAPPNFDLHELVQFGIPYDVHDNIDHADHRVISRTIIFRKKT